MLSKQKNGCLRLLVRRYRWEKRRTSTRSAWRKHGWNREEVAWEVYERSKVADAKSWQWLRAGYLGRGTERYVFPAQEQAPRR